MAKRPTLLQHFRSFAYQNNIRDFDKALEYFTVFGGTGWDVDISKPIETLIEEKILSKYESLHKSMIRYTHNNPVYHKLLTFIAQGTEHEHEVFKKAKIGKALGEEAIDYLEKKSLIKFDFSVEKPLNASDGKSDRVVFELPFMRFWFAMVSPYYKSIAEGDYTEVNDMWEKVGKNFGILLNNLLIRDLVQQLMVTQYTHDPIEKIGCYYDKHTYLEILAKRKSGKMIAGACKYAKDAAKINMLETLKSTVIKVELEVDSYVLFSKNGFTLEFEREQGMMLLSHTHMRTILDHLSKDDLLVYTNRKY